MAPVLKQIMYLIFHHVAPPWLHPCGARTPGPSLPGGTCAEHINIKAPENIQAPDAWDDDDDDTYMTLKYSWYLSMIFGPTTAA